MDLIEKRRKHVYSLGRLKGSANNSTESIAAQVFSKLRIRILFVQKNKIYSTIYLVYNATFINEYMPINIGISFFVRLEIIYYAVFKGACLEMNLRKK